MVMVGSTKQLHGQQHPETLNHNSVSTLMGLGFSEEHAEIAAEMWRSHCHGRVMTDTDFNQVLLEGFAKSFCHTREKSMIETLRHFCSALASHVIGLNVGMQSKVEHS